jgi:hypothetical protein
MENLIITEEYILQKICHKAATFLILLQNLELDKLF